MRSASARAIAPASVRLTSPVAGASPGSVSGTAAVTPARMRCMQQSRQRAQVVGRFTHTHANATRTRSATSDDTTSLWRSASHCGGARGTQAAQCRAMQRAARHRNHPRRVLQYRATHNGRSNSRPYTLVGRHARGVTQYKHLASRGRSRTFKLDRTQAIGLLQRACENHGLGVATS